MDKFLILHIEGGLGKNVAATALLKPLKEKYSDRKLIVVASWPEIFLNNPDVYRVYATGHTPYFFDDYVKNKDTIILRKEPYFENNHIMRHTSLMQTWFDMYGIEYVKEKHIPTLPMNMMQQTYNQKWQRNKPILLIQTNGGPHESPNVYSWTRDMPPNISTNIANEYIKKGYHVIQICKPNSYKIPNVEIVDTKMTNFELFSLLSVSNKRLLIDSCLQHAAVAYSMKSVVLWVGTSPRMFGYDLHTNISAKEPEGSVKLLDSYIFDYDFQGHYHQCPYTDISQLFDYNEILSKLDNL